MAWTRALKRHLVAGVVVVAPVAVTAFVLWRVFQWLDSLLGRWLYQAIGQRLPGLGLVALLLLLVSAGWIAERAIGARIVRAWQALLARIPFTRRVYPVATRVFRGMFGAGGRPFREVVLVESPVRGRWSVGFVTAAAPPAVQAVVPNSVTVFVPRAPNVYTGDLVVVARENAIPLPLTPEEALTFFVSAGSVGTADDERARDSRTAGS